MGLTRKELLAGAAAAGVIAGCGGSKPPNTPLADLADWAAVKAQFALSKDVRHFDGFLLASHPRAVRDAIERHRRGLDADPAGYLAAREAELDARVARAAASFLGVHHDDLAFTDSTTMGLGLVYDGAAIAGLPVATEHDFYATHESLELRFGEFRTLRLYDEPWRATAEEIVERVKDGIRADTGLLALTWVHSGTGVKLPLAEIGRALDGARQRGLLVVVDGVHGLAADGEPVSSSSYDVLVAGTHKWLGGPRGTGLVWSEGAWSRLTSAIPSFHPDRPGASRFTPGGYHSFEHRWALAEAFDFAAGIGRERIVERVAALATRLKHGLAELPKVRLITPLSPAVSAGIVCFEVEGLEPPDAVARLREHRVAASVTPYRTPYVRLGTGLWVDETDVDAAVEAVAAL